MLKHCRLCPRNCGVNRLSGQIGSCHIGATVLVSSAMPHFGEESVLVGRGGSGTIFFAGCNLHCVFCQNYDISQDDNGRPSTPDQIAGLALGLAQSGCENINFVTPTHVSHAVAEAIVIARHRGLKVPTVYNCGGYESLETLKLLDGLIDIYMPDFKYAQASSGRRYSDVSDYPKIATTALAEMYRQKGPLQTNDSGIAQKGVMIRHLVMPADIADSRSVIDIVAATAPGCAINIMAQYRPAYQAQKFPELMELPPRSTIQALHTYATQKGLQLL